MSSKNKSQLRTENSTNFPNNNSQFITPERLRDFNNDVIDSMVVNQDTGSSLITSSFDNSSRDLTFTKVDGSTYTNNIPDATVATGSLLETASFDNGTRNMTFTKGDASTFDINIPGSTLDTGSLLVTASVVDATTTYTKGNGDVFTTTIDNVINATSASHAVFAEDSDDLILNVKNTSGADIGKGLAVHATGVTGENVNIELADASNSSNMPAIGVTRDIISNNASSAIVISGKIVGIDTSTFSAGENVYVGISGVLTSTKPTGSNLIQNIGIVGKVDASDGELIVLGSGRTNDLPNIAEGYAWIGDSNGVPQAVLTSSFAESTDTGSFAIKDQANTFTEGPQIASASDGNGYFKSQLTMPTTGFDQKKLWEANDQNLSVNGSGSYNVVQESLSHFNGYGRWYDGSWYQEFYDSGVSYGTEVTVNGGGWRAAVYASGSGGSNGRFYLEDNYDNTTNYKLDAQNIQIGTSGGNLAPQSITLGSTVAPLNLNASEITVNSPVNINGSLTASIDTGNVLVGDGSGVSYLVPTSSLVDTGSLLVTASVVDATTTYTKGDGSIFTTTIDTGSFAILNQANTFTTGPQIISSSAGYLKQQMDFPGNGSQIYFLQSQNNTDIGGKGDYSIITQGIANYGFNRWYDNVFITEYYAGGYPPGAGKYGAEKMFNGGGQIIRVYASGSADKRAELILQDDFDETTNFTVNATGIEIGTSGASTKMASDGINIGSTSSPVNIASSALTVSSSLDIEGGLTSSLQSGYVWVGDGTGRTTTAATSSFGGGGGAAFPYTGDAQITGSLGVSGSIVIQEDSYPNNRLGFKSGSTEYVQMYIDTGSEFVPDAWVINHHSAGQILGIANANGWIEINTNLNMNNNSIIRGNLTIRDLNQDAGYTATFDKVSVNTTLTLSPQNPLPAGSVGEMAASGSNLYFNNGTVWKEVSFV